MSTPRGILIGMVTVKDVYGIPAGTASVPVCFKAPSPKCRLPWSDVCLLVA